MASCMLNDFHYTEMSENKKHIAPQHIWGNDHDNFGHPDGNSAMKYLTTAICYIGKDGRKNGVADR